MADHPNSHYFEGITFSPSRYAEREAEALEVRLQSIRERAHALAEQEGAADVAPALVGRLLARHEMVTRTHWAALGRCMSTMIAGPANFPVARNKKRYEAADKRAAEIAVDLEKALKHLERTAYPNGLPGGPIRGDDPEAIQKLTARLASLKGARWGAERRRLELRIANLTTRAERGTQERIVAGVRVVENAEADRIQLIFPDKPGDAERGVLKSNGFRWSPRFGAWQRHLNNNGRWAAERVLSKRVAA